MDDITYLELSDRDGKPIRIGVTRHADGTYGLKSASMSGTSAVAWQAVVDTSIDIDHEYQVLFAAGTALNGGYIINTSPPGSEPLWIDPTGAMGATPSSGAMPVYPATDPTMAPGVWRVPPTLNVVTIYGAAGSTFKAFHG